MDIAEVADIIHRISAGFEENVIKCLEEQSDIVLEAVKEQLYSGLDSKESHLSPTYDDDTFFDKKGKWYHRNKAYKEWKKKITQPVKSEMLGLPARPDNVPNLYIKGTFYSQISAQRTGDMLDVTPGSGKGPEIVGKYENQILDLGPTAVGYFNSHFLIPSIEKFLKDCGYK